MKTHRIYCNGADHVAAGLSAECRNTVRGANYFVLAARFAPELEYHQMIQHLEALPDEVLRRLNGRIRRAWNLAPCRGDGRAEVIPCDRVETPDLASGMEVFADQPMRRSVAVRYAKTSDGDFWLFKFSHLLFDGIGAEGFIAALLRHDLHLMVFPPSRRDSGLHHWGELMRCGKRSMRYLIALCGKSDFAVRKAPPEYDGSRVHFLCRSFSYEAISLRAEELAGPFMSANVLAAMCARAFHRRRKNYFHPGAMLFPASVNLRRPGGEAGCLSNEWSFFPYFWQPEEEDPPLNWWVNQARKCMTEALAADLPRDLFRAGLPMRILPARLMGRFVTTRFRGTSGCAMFSFVPDNRRELDGSRTYAQLWHAPTMPPDPGLGIFFTVCGSSLNLVLSSTGDVFDRNALEQLLEAISAELDS